MEDHGTRQRPLDWTTSAASCQPKLLDAAVAAPLWLWMRQVKRHRQVAYWQHSRSVGRHNERHNVTVIIFFIKPVGKILSP